MSADKPYLDLVREVILEGVEKPDRTGTGTFSLFGPQMCFDLQAGFPLLTTKYVHWPAVLRELLGFVAGATNVAELGKIWAEWADEEGELGPIYGVQWRDWLGRQGEHIDQLDEVVRGLRSNPNDRRLIVSAWNVGELCDMALPPCHLLFQFYSRPTHTGRYLDCKLYQRSADMGLGVPFNIASYSALVHMVAKITGHRPGRFIWTGGDVHIYRNHIAGMRQQLRRRPLAPPHLVIHGDQREIDDFKAEDFELVGYVPHPAIKFDVAV